MILTPFTIFPIGTMFALLSGFALLQSCNLNRHGQLGMEELCRYE